MARPSIWPPPVYHHKASGQARVRIAGKDYYLGPYGSPEAQVAYARLLEDLVARGEVAPPTKKPDAPAGPPVLTVANALAHWWKHAEQTYSARGRELDQFRLALEPLERLFGSTPVAEFDTDSLDRLQQAMASGSWLTAADRKHHRRPQQGGWARSVVNARVVKVRTVWRWLELQKLVPKGTWASLCTVRPLRRGTRHAREAPKRRPATWEETQRVAACCTPPVRAMLLVQWWTGCRSGEVRIMRVCDVEIPLDTMGFPIVSDAVWTYRPYQHKNDWRGEERVVVIGPQAQEVIRPWLERARQEGEEAYVFPPTRLRKHPYHTEFAYAEAVRRAARRAGLPGWHAYMVRHAAKMRISREFGDEAARCFLGQKTLDSTVLYGQRDLDLAADVARRLG